MFVEMNLWFAVPAGKTTLAPGLLYQSADARTAAGRHALFGNTSRSIASPFARCKFCAALQRFEAVALDYRDIRWRFRAG